MNVKQQLSELSAFDRAAEASAGLAQPALKLAAEFEWHEVREIFRRVAANEIAAGGFLRRFAEAATAADLENFAILLPNCYKLLAKYPHLVEQHRAKPAITSFPPEEGRR